MHPLPPSEYALVRGRKMHPHPCSMGAKMSKGDFASLRIRPLAPLAPRRGVADVIAGGSRAKR